MNVSHAIACAGLLVASFAIVSGGPDELDIKVPVSDYTQHATARASCEDTASKVVLHLVTTRQTTDVPNIDAIIEELCK